MRHESWKTFMEFSYVANSISFPDLELTNHARKYHAEYTTLQKNAFEKTRETDDVLKRKKNK